MGIFNVEVLLTSFQTLRTSHICFICCRNIFKKYYSVVIIDEHKLLFDKREYNAIGELELGGGFF